MISRSRIQTEAIVSGRGRGTTSASASWRVVRHLAARFAGTEPSLDAGILDRVCSSYFLTEAADLII
jgi:hypothetical protein